MEKGRQNNLWAGEHRTLVTLARGMGWGLIAGFVGTMAMDIILYHHEHWDGTGYPEGLKGEEIPLSARIISISDVYDALVSKRPYKKAYSHEASIEIMKEHASNFDPDLFKIFIDNASEYDLIRKQFLDK